MENTECKNGAAIEPKTQEMTMQTKDPAAPTSPSLSAEMPASAEREMSPVAADKPVPPQPEELRDKPEKLRKGNCCKWYYALPKPLYREYGGTLEITDLIAPNIEGENCKLFMALNGSEKLFVKRLVKHDPDKSDSSPEVKAIPFSLKEKGYFFIGTQKYLVFTAFDGNLCDVFRESWFLELDPDEKIRLLCSIVLKQLLATGFLYLKGYYNFDFKPGNVLYRILPDGRIDIRLIDMTESIIKGDPQEVSGVPLTPMKTEYFVAPAFNYYFMNRNEKDADPELLKSARSVVHLCDIYTLGLELYYFLSQGEYLIQDLPDKQFRQFYVDDNHDVPIDENRLSLLTDPCERAEIAVLLRRMFAWREGDNAISYVFCDEVITELVGILVKYNQLPQDMVIPTEYLPGQERSGSTDVALQIRHHINTDGGGSDFTEYQTFSLREGEACEVNLSSYNTAPKEETPYRQMISGRVFLLLTGGEVKCRLDKKWLPLQPGDGVDIDTFSGTHAIRLERMLPVASKEEKDEI